ncbi:TIGR04211 family SH3 domain-containing protein [Aestuariirhabdus sp. Z084]|uniref:TIGR04211 family SH3 domain-containing protein n=1 Tax=Aestuariirhabdus haliotis TaxID=2918751 RepID=UPI00201B3528|nr:TIGR04211 family SH3 domain-containing protein [Aestuariirhabdus haliotis]MCL6417317.1 TIGR04211 family SH3 domain-containing protein [Aestuariirhabdus haliotis]MCL6421262.1 TIGR04211 family SH3 domain-containing protein [Aestuariirhabdus haliotis]
MSRLPLHAVILSAVALAASYAPVVNAEARYISDILYVPLRSGPSNANKIIHKGLKSGTRVEFLKEEDEEFSMVRTTDGVEGFIRTQYLLTEPGAREQFARAQQRVEKLTQENSRLKQRLSELEKTSAKLSRDSKQSSQKNIELDAELKEIKRISSEAINLVGRNKELVERNVILKNRIDALELENSQLNDDSDKQWYLYGALTIVGGILIGLIAPLMRGRRNRSSGWA